MPDAVQLAKDYVWKQHLIHQLMVHEGVRRKRYFDSLGFPTVGVGFNLDREDAEKVFEAVGITDFHEVKNGTKDLTLEEVKRLLEYTLDEVLEQAKDTGVNWEELSPARKAVVADMVFNLGKTTFLKFVNTRNLIATGRYGEAARAMLHSRWAGQVKSRALHLARMMRDDIDFNTAVLEIYG